jgi:nucleotide-binding universal stress UspA family protein
LISRGGNPYEKILVPFDGTGKAERALEVAIDLSQQLSTNLAVVVVEEPDFLHGETAENGQRLSEIWSRVRELARVHKIGIEERTMAGNPVREISQAASEFGLIVISSTSEEKDLLSPHLGESLAQEAPCSVLIVTD